MNTPKESGYYWAKPCLLSVWEPVEVSGPHVYRFDEEKVFRYQDFSTWGPKIEYPQTITDEEAEYIQNYVDPLRDPARDIYA